MSSEAMHQHTLARALKQPGLPTLGYDVTPAGDRCGLILALVGHEPLPDAGTVGVTTSLSWRAAAVLHGLLAALLEDVDHTAIIDPVQLDPPPPTE